MTNYLSNLVARQLDLVETVKPRLASRFELPVALHPPGRQSSPNDALELDTPATDDRLGPVTDEWAEPMPDAAAQRRTTRRHMPQPVSHERDAFSTEQPESSARNPVMHARPSATFERTPADTSPLIEPARTQPINQPAPAEDASASRQSLKPLMPPPSVSPVVREQPSPPTSELQSQVETVEAISLPPVRPEPRIVRQAVKLEAESAEQPAQLSPTLKRDPVETTASSEAARQSAESLPDQTRLAPFEPPESKRPFPSLNASLTEASRKTEQPLVEPSAPQPARSPQPGQSVLAQPHITRSRETQAPVPAEFDTAPEPAPIINVTIGRVEVRASQAPASGVRRQESAAKRLMSLDDYLRQRAGGGGR